MREEIWLDDLRRQAAWDAELRCRPRCADCGEVIPFGRCLRLDEERVICESCAENRTLEAELWDD